MSGSGSDGPADHDDANDAPAETDDAGGPSESDGTDGDGGRLRSTLGLVPWRRIGHVIGVLLLIAIVVPFVIYAVPQTVGASESYVVLSGSMEPEISPGDVIIVESIDPSDIEAGDVITYERGSETQTTTHRVIDVVETDGGVEFETQGDANENPDQEHVTESQLEGKVMTVGGSLFVIPLIGYVIQFAGTQLGFALLVVTPLVLFVLSEVWSFVRSTTGGESATDAGSSSDAGAASNAGTTTDAGPIVVDGATTAEKSLPVEGGDDGEPTVEQRSGEPSETDDASENEARATGSAGWLTVRATELRLAVMVTAAFSVYSVWVAYVTLTVWAVGVAASVTTAFLLIAGLYASDRSGSSDADASDASADGTPEAVDDGTESTGEVTPDGDREGVPDDGPWGPGSTGGISFTDRFDPVEANTADGGGSGEAGSEGDDSEIVDAESVDPERPDAESVDPERPDAESVESGGDEPDDGEPGVERSIGTFQGFLGRKDDD